MGELLAGGPQATLPLLQQRGGAAGRFAGAHSRSPPGPGLVGLQSYGTCRCLPSGAARSYPPRRCGAAC
eukprot:12633266-Alexandrium_andersonii.AAC.1